MIDHLLIDTITKFSTTRNRFGDFVYGESVEIPCWFRDVNEVTQTNFAEEIDADAICYIGGQENVELSDILIHSGSYFKIERIVEERRLGETDPAFFQLILARHRQVS